MARSDLRAEWTARFFWGTVRLYWVNRSVRLNRVCLAGRSGGVDTVVLSSRAKIKNKLFHSILWLGNNFVIK